MSIWRADQNFERFEDITAEFLKKENVKLLLCDLDNTLASRSRLDPDDNIKNWLKECQKAGTAVAVISNNGFKARVKRFCKPLDVPYFSFSLKPLTRNVFIAMGKFGGTQETTAILGDKWSTDILCGKFAGIKTWKVKRRRR